MTVRRRLLLGILVVLAALIAAVGIAEVVSLRQFLYDRTAQGLVSNLRLVSLDSGASASGTSSTSGCPSRVHPPGASPGGGGKGGGATLSDTTAATYARALAAKGIASAIVAPNGTVLACAGSGKPGQQGTFGVPPAAFQIASGGDGGAGYQVLDDGGHHLLAVSQRLGKGTDAAGAVLVADLGEDDAALGTVIGVTALGGLVALLAAALLSWPLLRSALAPLRRVAATANLIAAGRFDERARLAQTGDEVGQLGRAFDRMADRLQDKDETMRRFLADASHELRTPLTAIRGAAQVLLRGGADDPIRLERSLRHVQTEAERMSRLVNDLLVLSQVDDRDSRTPLTPLDMGELLGTEQPTLQTLQTIAGRHPIRLEARPAWVLGERDRLLRICSNLVDNAAKYTPDLQPIELSVATVDGSALLRVRDHGPGIPTSDRERVFERFYRGDPARSRTTGGSGLGLPIVRSLVRELGGEVTIADGNGGGAELIVRLPATAPPPPTES